MSFYKKNMIALKSKVPAIAKWIAEQSNQTWIQDCFSKNGLRNILVTGGNITRPIYNMEDPSKEAQEIVKSYGELHRNNVSLVIGMGLGYLVKELIKSKDSHHKIIVIEPIADFIRKSFEIHDFSKEINKNQIYFANCKADVHFLLSMIEGKSLIDDWILNFDGYTKIRPEYYELSQFVMDIISQLRCNTGTVVSAGKMIAENDIKTLPYCLGHRGVSDLKDLFKGKPCILVNTGPSLEKNIHLLLDKEVQEKFVIVAVGQALRILLAYGITPDLIGSVDYGPVNYSHYKGLLDCGVPLVALNRSYAPLIQNWNGPVFITVSPTPGFDETIVGLLQEKGGVEQGGSVSHMIYGIANWMGCDPIILLGQDLAYEGNKSHTSQADESGTVQKDEYGNLIWDIKDPQSNIKGMHSFGGSVKVPGFWGKDVETNIGLMSFITSFERIFEHKRSTIINATEGGAFIKGTVPMTLQKVIEQYGQGVIDKSVIIPLLTEDSKKDLLFERAKILLESDIKNMEEIVKECTNALGTCNKIMIPKTSMTDIKKLLFQNKRASVKAHDLCAKNPLINLCIFGATRKILHRDLQDVDGTVKKLTSKAGTNDLKKRVESNQIIIKAAKESAEYLIPIYKEMLEQIKKGTPTKESEPLPDLFKIDEYFEIGNWAWPLLATKKVLEKGHDFMGSNTQIIVKAETLKHQQIEDAKKKYSERTDGENLLRYNELIKEAQKLGRDDKKFDESHKLLLEAAKLMPDKTEALWGLASSLAALQQYAESLTYYDKICAMEPDNINFQFEKGVVLIHSGHLADGTQIISDIMEKTHEYDYFLKNMASIYMILGNHELALKSIDSYRGYFPYDPKGIELKIKMCSVLKDIVGKEETEKELSKLLQG